MPGVLTMQRLRRARIRLPRPETLVPRPSSMRSPTPITLRMSVVTFWICDLSRLNVFTEYVWAMLVKSGIDTSALKLAMTLKLGLNLGSTLTDDLTSNLGLNDVGCLIAASFTFGFGGRGGAAFFPVKISTTRSLYSWGTAACQKIQMSRRCTPTAINSDSRFAFLSVSFLPSAMSYLLVFFFMRLIIYKINLYAIGLSRI